MNPFFLSSDNLIDQGSYKKNFLFVHIPKTAGTAIAQALSTTCYERDIRKDDTPEYNNELQGWKRDALRIPGVGHGVIDPKTPENVITNLNEWRWDQDSEALQLWKWTNNKNWGFPSEHGQNGFTVKSSTQERWHHLPAFHQKKVLSEVWDQYFTFGFVRNPWDWMISWYTYFLKRQLRGAPICDWLQKDLSSYEDFNAFVRGRNEGNHGRWLPSCLSRNLVDETGEVVLDYVGKMENIQKDFDNICDIIGMKKRMLPNKDHWSRNVTDHEQYRKYYNEESKKIIAKRFEKTIDLFGYTF